MLDWLLGNSKELAVESAQKASEAGYINTINQFILVTAISFFILIIIGRGAGGAGINLLGAIFMSYLWNFWIFK